MKVKELIEMLYDFNEDYEVVFQKSVYSMDWDESDVFKQLKFDNINEVQLSLETSDVKKIQNIVSISIVTP